MAWVHCPVPPGCCGFGGGHISLAVLLWWTSGGHSHKLRGRWRPLPSYVSVVLFLRVGVLLMCEWGLEARLIKQQQQPRNKAKCANVASRCETDESGLLFLHTTQRYTGLKKLFANELLLLWCAVGLALPESLAVRKKITSLKSVQNATSPGSTRSVHWFMTLTFYGLCYAYV